jgi:hypothetical protein
MDDFESQFQSLLILFGLLLVPAIVTLAVFMYIRKRRSSFHQKHRSRSSQSRRGA